MEDDLPISQLPDASPLGLGDLFAVVQAGRTNKATVASPQVAESALLEVWSDGDPMAVVTLNALKEGQLVVVWATMVARAIIGVPAFTMEAYIRSDSVNVPLTVVWSGLGRHALFEGEYVTFAAIGFYVLTADGDAVFYIEHDVDPLGTDDNLSTRVGFSASVGSYLRAIAFPLAVA